MHVCESIKIYLHLPGTIIARRKRFFRGTLANLCNSEKCIIFNVDYHLWSKKSKVDITLIRHSSFKRGVFRENLLIELTLYLLTLNDTVRH